MHQVTIGVDELKNNKAPVIGNNVFIGAGAKIIGNIQLFQSTHIFNRETGAMSQLAESSTKQWRLADTFVCGRGVPIGKFVRPYLHFKGKEQGRIDLTLTL